jgi:hypothetical protein
MSHVDHSAMKVGKRHAVHDNRTLQMAKYVDALPPAPVVIDWTKGVDSWPMYLNDTLGCCTVAAAAHHVQAWTTAAIHSDVKVSDADVLAGYEALGYRPGHPDTDQGAVELVVLKRWRKYGFFNGHKIGAFVSVDPHSQPLIMDGLYLTGGLYTGFQLPITAQRQTVWEVPAGGPVGKGAPGSWGGHAVPIVAADPRGVTIVTWGALKRVSWSFVATYCDEAYALLSNDFLNKGKAPNGFDLATLQHDLSLL